MASADVEIIVGAKDQASKILEGVEKSTRDLTRTVAEMGEKTQQSSATFAIGLKGMAVAAAGIGAAIAAAKGLAAAIAGASESVAAFNLQEEAARGMTDAQLEFAAALQVATNVGDEATLALMRQAEMMGVQKNLTDDVAAAAIGLTEAFGGSYEDNLKKINQAINGNANAFAEYLPELAKITNEEEKLAIISEAAGKGLAKLQEDTNSTAGMMERAQGAFGDLQEKIGALLAPIYSVVHEGFAVFAETLQVALMPAIGTVNSGFESMRPIIDMAMEAVQAAGIIVGVVVESIVNVMGSMVSAFVGSGETIGTTQDFFVTVIDQAARVIIGAITAIEVVFTNLGTVAELAFKNVMLWVESMRADLEHAFTNALPSYVQWFGENFLNIIQDYFGAVMTVYSNFAGKIISFWEVIWESIQNGFEGGVAGVAQRLGEELSGSLLEGFEAKTKQLPEIASRAMTETEKALALDMARIGVGLTAEFNEKFNARIKGLDADLKAKVEIETPDLAEIAKAQNDGLKETIDKVSQLQANESRLLTRGASEDPASMTAQHTKQTRDAVKGLPAEIAKNLEPLIKPPSGGFQVEMIA